MAYKISYSYYCSTVYPKENHIFFSYLLAPSKINGRYEVKDLCIYFDSCLTFKQLYSLSSSSKSLAFIVWNWKKCRNTSVLKLSFSLVRSKLEYCSLIWYPWIKIIYLQLNLFKDDFWNICVLKKMAYILKEV